MLSRRERRTSAKANTLMASSATTKALANPAGASPSCSVTSAPSSAAPVSAPVMAVR